MFPSDHQLLHFNNQKEQFKKSVCCQIDDLFASFLNELKSTSFKSNNGSLGSGTQSNKHTKAISGFLPKTPVLSSILVSNSNGQTKGLSNVFQNNPRALPSKGSKLSKLNQQQLQQYHQQQQMQSLYEAENNGDDFDEEAEEEQYQTNNYMMKSDEYYSDDPPMIPEVIIREEEDDEDDDENEGMDEDEEDDNQMIEMELQNNQQQQQQMQHIHPNNCHCPDCIIEEGEDNEDEEEEAADLQDMNAPQVRQQKQSNSSAQSTAGVSQQQTRLSQRLTAMENSRRSSSASTSSSKVSFPDKMNGRRPLLRGSAARRIVPPPQPATPPRRQAVIGGGQSSSSGKARPHICRWCQKNFPSKQRLTMHEVSDGQVGKRNFQSDFFLFQRIHQGVRPYSCKWEGCQYKSIQEAHMLRHIRSRHYLLPVTVKMQASRGIIDNRDPRIFMEVHQDLLEKSRMLRENGSLDRVKEEED